MRFTFFFFVGGEWFKEPALKWAPLEIDALSHLHTQCYVLKKTASAFALCANVNDSYCSFVEYEFIVKNLFYLCEVNFDQNYDILNKKSWCQRMKQWKSNVPPKVVCFITLISFCRNTWHFLTYQNVLYSISDGWIENNDTLLRFSRKNCSM